VLCLQLPFKLGKFGMDGRFRDATVVQDRGLKQIVQLPLGPLQQLANFSRHESHPFAMVNVGHPHQIQRIGQRVNGFMQVDLKLGHSAPCDD